MLTRMGELARDNLPKLAKADVDVGIACAMYNSDIVQPLLAKCKDKLVELHQASKEPSVLHVPGSLELAYGLRVLALSEPDVLVALGCVIRGDTYHFEVVCDVSAHALQRVSEDTGIPVINGVLTCENMEQAKERLEKGIEFAESAVQMALLVEAKDKELFKAKGKE